MNKKKVYIYISLGIVLFLGWIFSNANKIDEDFSERVKVSLRNVGHQLLLSNQDSTSLVLPITELENSKYKISFQNNLSINPDSLTSIIKQNLKKSKLSKYYRTEVVQCDDNEVAYSYEIKNKKESDIIPCKGRLLPKNCYVIEVKFTTLNAAFFNRYFFLFGLIVLLLLFGFDYVFSKPKIEDKLVEIVDATTTTTIGIFQFYPEQNKLVKQATEISLSKKECELLAIFVENPNQIIKRDELMKKVWEDNGVFVGRSLDTYISKLRKKLKEDSSIKITNIHGVGYKLEVN